MHSVYENTNTSYRLKKKKTETKQNVRLENLDDRDLHIPDPTVRLGVLKGFLTNL